ILAAALVWIVGALRGAGADAARLRLLRVTLATVGVAATGAVLRFVPATASGVPWLSVIMLDLAILLAAYGVFSQGIFLTPGTARYAFRYTVVIGLGVSVYVVAMLGLDQLSQLALGIDVPIITGLALVATMALFEPVAGWARRTVRGRSSEEKAYDRLLRALGQDVLTAQRPEAVVVPALARLSRTFRLLGAQVETGAGEIIAKHGKPVVESPLACRVPLRTTATEPGAGSVIFGPKRSLLPFTPDEAALLAQGAAYLSASLRLAEMN